MRGAARVRAAGATTAGALCPQMMRMVCWASLSAGCGYGSYYPEPARRDGGALVVDTGPSGPTLPCSDPSPSAATLVQFINPVPVDLRWIDADCRELPLATLSAAYSGHAAQLDEGTIIAVYDLSDVFLTHVEVPDTDGGTWTVEVP
ncbi:MAG: hypothetical protein RL071_3571 [Pseudomonadota bacterium]